MTAPDVVVIGGGIVGVAAAAHAAALGASVVLFEREAIAAAASGRNSGVVQHPADPVLAALYAESVELYRALPGDDRGAFALPPVPSGLLMVSHDADGVAAIAARLRSTHPALDPTFLAPGIAAREEPALDPSVAACRLSIGYPVAPAAATRAYAAWARRCGARLEIGRAARPSVVAGAVEGVVLEDGERLPARAVVVAAGPWSPALVDPTGSWQPIVRVWGAVVDVELAAPPRHVLEEAEIGIEPGDDAAADVSFSLVTAGGTSALGSTFLADEPDHAALVPSLLAHGRRFVPALASGRIGRSRACARPQSRDGRPLVGRVPGADGLWIAAGNGPWGISTGPATGRLAAALVLGREPAPPAALDPARFGQRQEFGSVR